MSLEFLFLFWFIIIKTFKLMEKNCHDQSNFLKYCVWNSIITFLTLSKLFASYHSLFDKCFIQFIWYCSFLFLSDRREFRILFIFHLISLLITTNNSGDSIWLKNKSFGFFHSKNIWKLLWIFMKFWNFNFTFLFFDAIILNDFNCLSFNFLMSHLILIFFIDNQILFFV